MDGQSILRFCLWFLIGYCLSKILLHSAYDSLLRKSKVLEDVIDCKSAIRRGLTNYTKDATYITKNLELVKIIIETYDLKEGAQRVIVSSSDESKKLLKVLLRPTFWWKRQISKNGKKQTFESIISDETRTSFRVFHEFVLFIEKVCEKMLADGVLDKGAYYAHPKDYEK